MLSQPSGCSNFDVFVADEKMSRAELLQGRKRMKNPGGKILTLQKIVHGSPNFATNFESPVPSAVGDQQGDESRHR